MTTETIDQEDIERELYSKYRHKWSPILKGLDPLELDAIVAICAYRLIIPNWYRKEHLASWLPIEEYDAFQEWLKDRSLCADAMNDFVKEWYEEGFLHRDDDDDEEEDDWEKIKQRYLNNATPPAE